MKFRIVHESDHRIRIRLYRERITAAQEEILKFAFSHSRGVREIRVFPATAGLSLTYDCTREELLAKLSRFQFGNVVMMAKEEKPQIEIGEVKERKLSPELKRSLRLRVLMETVFDLTMPVPLQVGYHVYQMITLRDI